MFCKHCGNQIIGNEQYCPSCGKSINDNTSVQKKEKQPIHWVLIFVAIGLLLLSLLLGLNLGDNVEATEVILPAILSLCTVGLTGYVFINTKNQSENKSTHIFSLIVLIGGIVMALELCIGPLIGTLIA